MVIKYDKTKHVMMREVGEIFKPDRVDSDGDVCHRKDGWTTCFTTGEYKVILGYKG